MNIDEIIQVDTGGVNLPKIDRTGEQAFGFNNVVDNYDMMKNTYDSYSIYYLIDDDQIIAATVIIEIKVNGKDYLQINGVWVKKEYRGQNLAVKMYHSIKHNENKQLASDIRQTNDAKKLWAKLDKTFDLAIMNLNTGEIISKDIKDAYKNYFSFDEDELVIVTETELKPNSLIIPPLKIRT